MSNGGPPHTRSTRESTLFAGSLEVPLTGYRPIVVTGATGNVGREVVKVLAAQGQSVRALVTDPASVPPGLGIPDGSIEIARFDFADPTTFEAAFRGAQAMFLMRPPAISNAAIMGRAASAAQAAGVRHMVFLSVQGAQHNPLVPHHRIERHLERLARAHPDFTYSFLRAAFFMQNLSTTHARDIREHDVIFLPAGTGRTAFVDARDVAAAAAQLLLHSPAPGECMAYELTGLEAMSYDDAALVLTSILGRAISYENPGITSFYRRMRQRGRSRAFIAVMIALYTTARLGMAAHLSPDLERLLRRPPISFAEFARDFADSWRPQ